MSTNRIGSIISFKELGWAEMLIALMPILGAYYLGPVPFSFWISLLLIAVSIVKKKRIDIQMFWPLILFICYFLAHEIVLLLTNDSFNINRRIEQLVFLISIICVVPMLEIKKLIYSLNFISLICIIGLFYQIGVIMTGGVVRPIGIPGLVMSEVRLTTLSMRPSSFFMEPAAYTLYMFAPLALSLINKKYWWATIIVISMLLTTSTTAFFSVFIILGVFAITQGLFRRNAFVIIIVGVILYYGYSNLSFFDVGRSKMEETDYEANVRIQQGPALVGTMYWNEFIFGAPYNDLTEYYFDGRTRGVETKISADNTLYITTAWNLIFSFGIVGLLLYLNVYYRLLKRCRILLPYIICLLVTMFTASIYIGVVYAYTMIILYTIAIQYNPKDELNKLTIN